MAEFIGIPVDQAGGRFNATEGMRLAASDLVHAGDIGLQSLMTFLACILHDEVNGAPQSGVFQPGDPSARHLFVAASGSLGFTMNAGVGFLRNAGATADEWAPSRYLPVVVEATYTGALATHDVTHPRIDLVCVAPAWADEESESRLVKDPLNPTDPPVATTVTTRRRFSYAVQVVTGTPAAAPAAPAVPAGYMEVGRARVPAITGAAVWEDTRQPLQLTTALAVAPRWASGTTGHVLKYAWTYDDSDLGEPLQVTPSTPNSLVLQVASGRAVAFGHVRKVKAGTVTLSAAHATLNRIDLVVVSLTGSLDKKTGTPGASPVAPTADPGTVVLAQVLVAATATTIGSGQITDRRVYQPFDAACIRPDSIDTTQIVDEAITNAKVPAGELTTDRIAVPMVEVDIGTIVTVGDVKTITVETFQLGTATPYTEEVSMVAEVWLKTDVATSAGDFAEAGSVTQVTYTQDHTTAPVVNNVGFVVGTDASELGGYGSGLIKGPLFFFSKDAGAPSCEIELRRQAGSVTGAFLVVIRPINCLGTQDQVVTSW